MTPIFMIKDGQSRFVKGDDGLREYLRTEYGNPDSAWITAETRKMNGHVNEGRKTAGLRAWISWKLRGRSPHGEEAGA